MANDRNETADARHRARLEAFVVRARRIEAHSLVQDREALRSLANSEWSIVSDSQQITVRQELPPEEVVESAAARVRPLLLKGEQCHYDKALTAIAYFVREGTVPAQMKALRAQWRRRVEETDAEADGGYQVTVHDPATGRRGEMNDISLAHAWIYGDVVHHDAGRRAGADPFGLQERFRAAVPLIAWTTLATIELLDSIRALHAAQRLELSPAALDQPVVLKETTFAQEAKVYTAPVGTPPPADAAAPFPEGWSELVGPDRPTPP
ncbi:hypothetical protein [Streptomyces violens]|uniref:hypothetical protein n=1 Tax=Streptomyces violens TaxID=66377 RepID=UPI0004C2352C|nr:hypothetical protein [Streptomyces violens]